MFPYTEQYTEFDKHIQNNDLLHKIHQKCQATFEKSQKSKKFREKQNAKSICF